MSEKKITMPVIKNPNFTSTSASHLIYTIQPENNLVTLNFYKESADLRSFTAVKREDEPSVAVIDFSKSDVPVVPEALCKVDFPTDQLIEVARKIIAYAESLEETEEDQ